MTKPKSSGSFEEASRILWSRTLYGGGKLSAGDILTIFGLVGRSRQKSQEVQQLNFQEWQLLLDGTRRLARHSRAWQRRYLKALRLSTRDFLSTEPVNGFARHIQIDWLQSLAQELSPQGFSRKVLHLDNEHEFRRTTEGLLVVLLESARALEAGSALVGQIIRSMEFATPKERRGRIRRVKWVVVGEMKMAYV